MERKEDVILSRGIGNSRGKFRLTEAENRNDKLSKFDKSKVDRLTYAHV